MKPTRSVDGKLRFTIRVNFRVGHALILACLARAYCESRENESELLVNSRNVAMKIARRYLKKYGECVDLYTEDVEDEDWQKARETLARLFPDI